MKVIVCGAGQVGSNIARYLSSEGSDVTIIDSQADLVEKVTDSLDVPGVVGFASHPEVLEKVGGPGGLIYCTTGISPGDLEKLPLTSGYTYTGESRLELMVQCAIQRTLATWQQRLGRLPRVGIIRDGAHTIPRLIGAGATI